MNFAIIGTGYVGLVTGSCFAETGNDVICVDVDSKRIESLTSGKIPFYEPGLEEIVKRNVKEGRLVFTNNIKEAVENSLIIFICVGTPSLRSGEANLSYVFKSAEEIGKAMDGYKVVIAKSTAPVGTTEKIREIINKWTVCSFDIVSNPEFLKEGTAVEDFMKPDRVIIGANDDKVAGIIKEIYSPFVRTGKPILIMDIKSAEMTKYAANALLATKISFMNEMANLCELVGADIDKVRRGIGSDPRIGPYFLFPGVGFGGSCFPKDIKAIINTAQKKGYDLEIMNAVKSVNDKQREILLKKIYNFFSGKLKDKQVAIWGLSFKPKTNDIRDAPSVYIIEKLLQFGTEIRAYDPAAGSEVKKVFKDGIKIGQKSYEVLGGADALIIITEWNEFREPNFSRIKKLMRTPVVFDGRNIYNPFKMREMGFKYFGIGTL